MGVATTKDLKYIFDNFETIEAYGEIFLNEANSINELILMLARQLDKGEISINNIMRPYTSLLNRRQKKVRASFLAITITRQLDQRYSALEPSMQMRLLAFLKYGNWNVVCKKLNIRSEQRMKDIYEKEISSFIREIYETTMINHEIIEELQLYINEARGTKVKY